MGALPPVQVCKIARYVDPYFATQALGPAEVDFDCAPIGHHISTYDLQRELSAYITAAQGVTIDHADVATFTAQVLHFWKNTSKKELQKWLRAVSIMFFFHVTEVFVI